MSENAINRLRLSLQELAESRMDFRFFNLFTGLSWITSYKVREFPIFLNSSSSTTVSFQERWLTLSVLDHVCRCVCPVLSDFAK